MTYEKTSDVGGKCIKNVRGDYSNIRRLKVIGPISGADLDLLRYMAGYCPWAQCRNYSGRLEYIDLYDANLVESEIGVIGYERIINAFMTESSRTYTVAEDNYLPKHAFLRAYNLKTLILPRTCKEVENRALQECEGLETLVLGDDMETFNWNALDDDAMLTRMYILAKKKVTIDTQVAVWRWLCNNYSPTFDAFYVRPSLYEEYIHDDAYVDSDWQRTNNISTGIFDDDEAFTIFGAHAAATYDDLTQVYSVDGWFDHHSDVKDLTALSFTAVDSLRAVDMQKLTKLERVALPATLESMEYGLFAQSPDLRYVDMILCDSTSIADQVKARGFNALGIDTQKTLVYLPKQYGEATGTNVVVDNGTEFRAETFRMLDDKDYCVPYTFKAGNVVNTRSITNKDLVYTVCLPYELTLLAGMKAYTMSDREGDNLVFKQITASKLEAFRPYLIKVGSSDVTLSTDVETEIPTSAGAYGQQINAPGYTMRGTLSKISNADLYDMGGYLLQNDNKWYKVPNNVEVAYAPPFRCYLLQNGGGNDKSINSIFVDDNTATDIEAIRTVDTDGTEELYDLSGRRIQQPGKGIYIVNGKKVYVK